MIPGFTERECRYAEMRRQELLATVERQRRFAEPRRSDVVARSGMMHRCAGLLRDWVGHLVAATIRPVA